MGQCPTTDFQKRRGRGAKEEVMGKKRRKWGKKRRNVANFCPYTLLISVKLTQALRKPRFVCTLTSDNIFMSKFYHPSFTRWER